MSSFIQPIQAQCARMGIILEQNGDPYEAEGVLNPASARSRDGKLLLYPRLVAKDNISRIGLAESEASAKTPIFKRIGFALEPTTPYELGDQARCYGCEDPRVTFIPVLDSYVMAYTACGPQGPRIAAAISNDAYAWKRIGLLAFAADLPQSHDKDGAFFPEPAYSPSGVLSIALYHRPMFPVFGLGGRAETAYILKKAPRDRDCIRIGYIPLEPVLRDRRALLNVTESAIVLEPDARWGSVRIGAGTPPVRIDEGWMSLYHAVDMTWDDDGKRRAEYRAGLVVHDLEQPHIVRYRSPEPLLTPETPEEAHGVVDNVVFPTAIDACPGDFPRSYDVYYGMADARIGLVKLRLGASEPKQENAA